MKVATAMIDNNCSRPVREVDAAARRIADRDHRVLHLELRFDLSKRRKQTTGVADVQFVARRLRV